MRACDTRHPAEPYIDAPLIAVKDRVPMSPSMNRREQMHPSDHDSTQEHAMSQPHIRHSPRRSASVIALVGLLGLAGPAAAESSGSWLYDGTTDARTAWMSDGSVTDDPSDYFGYSAPIGTQSVVGFADARAKSEVAALSADVFAVGTAGQHSAYANARANSLYYDFTPGSYIVSFGYELTNPQDGLIMLASEAGIEGPGFEQAFTSGSGTFSATLQLDGWVAFYAWATGSAADGTAVAQAKLTDLSIVAAPVPEPSTWGLFTVGLMLCGALRLRSAIVA